MLCVKINALAHKGKRKLVYRHGLLWDVLYKLLDLIDNITDKMWMKSHD